MVVGAGIAGSAVAFGLARAGWRVLVYEQGRLPRHKVCGEFLSPESRRSLHALGLLDIVRDAEPIDLNHASLTTRRGQTVRVDLPTPAWGLSRYVLDARLAMAAEEAGATLAQQARVVEITGAGAGYRVRAIESVHDKATPGATRARRERQIEARAVIVAAGRQSRDDAAPAAREPRRASVMARRRRHRRQQLLGVKGHFAGIEMPQGVELYLFPGGYVGINPIERHRVNVCALASYDVLQRAGRSVTSMLAWLSEHCVGLRSRLGTRAPCEETCIAVAAVDTEQIANPWGSTAQVGDAAAMVPPLCGDGMAIALRSAELCTPLADAFLRGRISREAWAATYRQTWHAEFDRRTRTSRFLQRALCAPLASEALVALARLVPPVSRYYLRATRGEMTDVPSEYPTA